MHVQNLVSKYLLYVELSWSQTNTHAHKPRLLHNILAEANIIILMALQRFLPCRYSSLYNIYIYIYIYYFMASIRYDEGGFTWCTRPNDIKHLLNYVENFACIFNIFNGKIIVW